MNLDDPNLAPSLDRHNMLAHITSLPDQLESAYRFGLAQPSPVDRPIQAVILAGMGGSAMAADLLEAYAAPLANVPLIVHRNYNLPAWANASTLVIATSHSGETEETLSAYHCAVQRGCCTLALSTGGALMHSARQNGTPHWRFEHHGQPRSAVGFGFGLATAALTRLRILPELTEEIADAASLMRSLQESFQPGVLVAKNRAKRDAGQLMGRWVAVFGADHLAPVARRWKGQINEMAKAWAQAEILPEADHNTLAGLVNPEEALMHTLALFLVAEDVHPRNQMRVDLTRQAFMEQGIGTDLYRARGETRMAQMWSALHYGDYLAYYLALAYGVDPTPVDLLEEFKLALRGE